jgi:hypothetical protein
LSTLLLLVVAVVVAAQVQAVKAVEVVLGAC